MDSIRYFTFASNLEPYQAARLAVLVVAALATVSILALARGGGPSSSPRLAAPAVLFAAGLAAFAATRAQASDAWSPMPHLPTSSRQWIRHSLVAQIPAAAGCEPVADDAPVVVLERGTFLVDGISVSDPDVMTRLLMEKRKLWEQVQGSRKAFPGVVAVAIAADTPLDAVRPMIVAAREAGYPVVDVIEALEVPPWRSRTLGDVAYAPRACRVRLSAGQEMPPVQTWGELARALAR
jgi:hypothetical protein